MSRQSGGATIDKNPDRLAASFGAAHELRVVALEEVDIPLDATSKTAIGAAPHRMIRRDRAR